MVRTDFYPKTTSRFFGAYSPFELDQANRLLESPGSQQLIASDPYQTESLKPCATMTDAEALWKALHVRINSKQYGVVRQGRRTNNFISSFFRKNLSVQDNKMAALLQNIADGIRNACVQKDAKNWPIRIRQLRYV